MRKRKRCRGSRQAGLADANFTKTSTHSAIVRVELDIFVEENVFCLDGLSCKLDRMAPRPSAARETHDEGDDVGKIQGRMIDVRTE